MISNNTMNRNCLLMSFVFILIVSLITQSGGSLDFIGFIDIEKEGEIEKIEESKEIKNLERSQLVTSKEIFSFPVVHNLAMGSIKVGIYTRPNEIYLWNEFNHSPPAFLS